MATAAIDRSPYRHPALSERMHLARSRGALSGLLLVLLGVWGGLIPFVGPEFGYAYTPDTSWTFTTGRLWLEILPAAAVVLGGLALLFATQRLVALTGAGLALLGGAWFVLGPVLSQLWNDGAPAAGSPASSSTLGSVVEQVGFFSGVGVAVLVVAGIALGRMSMVGLRDLQSIAAEREAQVGAVDLRRRGEPITADDDGGERTVVVHDLPRTVAEPDESMAAARHRRPGE